jgi:hypothetical protein
MFYGYIIIVILMKEIKYFNNIIMFVIVDFCHLSKSLLTLSTRIYELIYMDLIQTVGYL